MSNPLLTPENISFAALYQQLSDTRTADIARIKFRLRKAKQIKSQQKQANALLTIQTLITESIRLKQHKLDNLPTINYPDSLPVSQAVEKISEAISQHQVVIIAGETGSGKTTQIPKICLSLGRGINGFIGHTQPRRIAARTVANRIADELNSEVGKAVGYKVRFTDNVSDDSYIKLMTDGILLAEMQKDRLLRQYDTIIIDEAHERSLNIDFILGYLKSILPKRPDLKIIITSATIDPERFSTHFDNAPIIEVSGRTFPVEILYRPLEDYAQGDVINGIIHAVDELSAMSLGDILIFLNGEREIRDTAYALEKLHLPHTNILPLFSRLTNQEQNRIFAPHTGRNIVLATNVAETSLTVPGIKYVIDTGTARISRYSYRTKVQRLPIEPISQASANQRSGRCGRVSSGVCIRLYSQEDFNNRPEFTDPEILRTNLATVILQMLALDLGDIALFPFVQAPDNRHINDGKRLLEELNAIQFKQGKTQLTNIGRSLSKFPIDPRLSKMLLTAMDLNCIHDVLTIVSALSIQDPRERPMDKQQAADEKHAKHRDKESDFISLLNLWHFIINQQKNLTNNQFRKLCQQEFLSYLRIREWQDIYSQLKNTIRELNQHHHHLVYHVIDDEQQKQQHYEAIHRSCLSGLLSHIGQLDEQKEYKGARNSKFYIFPGSGVAKKSPKWVMAAELVETSRLFARMVAKIDVSWVEQMASHLVKRHYSEPHWEKKQGSVMAFEQVSLYGLIIVPKRRIKFDHIEPETCHELFILHALVLGESFLREKFLTANNALIRTIEQSEQKARRKNFLVDEQQMVEFYQAVIPSSVVSVATFKKWWKQNKASAEAKLYFTRQFLLNESDEAITSAEYPNTWHQNQITLPLSYHFSPGDEDDGVSVIIPLGILNQIENTGFDWLIPAMQHDLIVALIKGLPKTLRKNFVPAPNYADACLASMDESKGRLISQLSKQLLRMTGVEITEEQWKTVELPAHLTMNFKVVDENGKLLGQNRDLDKLKAQFQGKVKATIKKVADKGIEKQHIKQWDFGDLPKKFEQKISQITVQAFPALVDHQQDVAIELFEHEFEAAIAMKHGLARLVLLNIPSPVKYLQEHLPNKAKLGLYFNAFGSIKDLLDDCIQAACLYLISSTQQHVQNAEQFQHVKEYVRAEIADCVLAAAIKVEQALTMRHNLEKKLKGNVPLTHVQAFGDIKKQLNQLIFKGFVSQLGIERLDDLLRYLKALEKRMEKLVIDVNQDRLKSLEFEKSVKLCQQFIEKQPKSFKSSAQYQQIQHMLQEFNVSLFAQTLGTAFPISSKRIANYLKTLNNERSIS